MEWTKERTATLVDMWNKNQGAGEMQQVLGVSYNSVRSKLKRLREAGVIKPRRPAAPPSKQSDAHAPAGSTGLRAIVADQCRWPIGDPRDENFKFCGRKRETGKPYCAEHALKSSGKS